MDCDFLIPIEVWTVATEIDIYIAENVRADGCQHCSGGKLHRSNYRRKPRGLRDKNCNRLRYSFSCNQKSCRTRVNPVSTRFRRGGVYANIFYNSVSQAMKNLSNAEFKRRLGNMNIADSTLLRWKKEGANPKPTGANKFQCNSSSPEIKIFLDMLLENLGGDKSAFYDCMKNISVEDLEQLAAMKNR